MKHPAFILALAPLALFTSCTEHHYHPAEERTVIRERPVYRQAAPRKAAPSVSSEAAEEFRAVEKPGSYSQ